jgi:two-component system sensor histidine kinase CpxA
MKNLFIRIFASFWLIIFVTMTCAALAGYYYHQRMEQIYTNFEIDETVIRAGEILNTQGYSGLKIWLKNIDNRDQYPLRIFLLNSNKEDILGRRVPRRIVDWQNHFELSHHNPRSKKAKSRQTDLIIPDNLRPANSISVLIGPDKKIFELYFFPKNTSFEGIFNDNLRWLIFICVMVLSISVSYLLSRAITNPIRRFKHATRSIADGNFLTKVSDSVSQRKDEIGSLARDINRMSGKLYRYEEQAEELLRNISHELRSPLSRMLVALDIAQQKNTDGEIEYQRIKKEITILDELIGSILKYSSLDASKNEPLKYFNLDELAKEVIENVNYEFRTNSALSNTIILKSTHDIDFYGYESILKSALENILRNAVKYGPNHADILFEITKANEIIQISVIDNGSGVNQSDSEKIFEPFHRSTQLDTKEHESGSGLGLAIAKQAIELNKGEIQAITTKDNFEIKIKLPIRAESKF